jgi:Mrp family chromosome partitioning ATPase
VNTHILEQEMLETRMSVIKHKLLVVSGKGGMDELILVNLFPDDLGVGKSSVAWQLALILQKKGKKVSTIDTLARMS